MLGLSAPYAAQVRIGYEIVLMLLRNGAHVLGTTRFPADAAQRFAAEAGFGSFMKGQCFIKNSGSEI